MTTPDRAVRIHGHYYQPPRLVCQITRRPVPADCLEDSL
jgi:hypothetical protein